MQTAATEAAATSRKSALQMSTSDAPRGFSGALVWERLARKCSDATQKLKIASKLPKANKGPRVEPSLHNRPSFAKNSADTGIPQELARTSARKPPERANVGVFTAR